MPGTRNYLKVLLSWSLSIWYTEALTAPIIQFQPEQPAYIVRERMDIRCMAQNPSTVTGYTFYHNSAIIVNGTSTNLRTLFNLTTRDSGEYFCTYYGENGARSPESMLITLRVLEQPPAPSLFVMPRRIVFIKDQSAVLHCQLPLGHPTEVAGITLYQNGRESYDSDNFGVLNYTQLQIRNAGNYSCSYTVTLSGRSVPSYFSNTESLFVIEQPPIPRLRYAYNQNWRMELSCEVRIPSQIYGYRFYRNGIEIGSSRHLNSFTFNYTLVFVGCFSCRTFVTISGEEILSQKSLEYFLSSEGEDGQQCPENLLYSTVLTKQGLKFYGSILVGKIFVLLCILAISGVYLLIIQQRNKKSVEEVQ